MQEAQSCRYTDDCIFRAALRIQSCVYWQESTPSSWEKYSLNMRNLFSETKLKKEMLLLLTENETQGNSYGQCMGFNTGSVFRAD